MTQHILTIHLVFEVPDEDDDIHDSTVEALESATNDMLDEGTLQDWILDAAASHSDDFDDDTETISASCTMEEAKETK